MSFLSATNCRVTFSVAFVTTLQEVSIGLLWAEMSRLTRKFPRRPWCRDHNSPESSCRRTPSADARGLAASSSAGTSWTPEHPGRPLWRSVLIPAWKDAKHYDPVLAVSAASYPRGAEHRSSEPASADQVLTSTWSPGVPDAQADRASRAFLTGPVALLVAWVADRSAGEVECREADQGLMSAPRLLQKQNQKPALADS